jgi:peptide/nickel transport system permease protein
MAMKRIKEGLRVVRSNKLLLTGSIITLLVVIIALFAPWIAPYHPWKDADLLHTLEPPGGKFLLGTDRQGRDLLSRIVFGARISLMVGLVAQSINTLIGTALGLTAGIVGGKVDDAIMGLTNIMLSLPPLILALGIMAALGPGLFNIFIAVGFTYWTYTCRVTRGQTLTVKEKDFVEAARAIGASRLRIVTRHVLPHVLGPVLVIATMGVASAILIEASLSFLGVGTQPPTPSWGSILSRGRSYIWTAPWIMIFPGLAISITVLGVNLLGDGLRDILDPRLRRTR